MSSDRSQKSRTFSKIKNIELSDGWSFVTRSKGSGSGTKKRQPRARTPKNEQNDIVDENIVVRIINDVDKYVKQFDSSDCARTLKSALSPYGSGVDLAHCAGLGNLDPHCAVDTRRSKHQLAVFLWLVQVFSNEDCRLFASDPGFNPTDQAVLEHFQARVTSGSESDHGSALLGSLLYAPYLPWTVLTLDHLSGSRVRPDVIVCQDLRGVKENLELQRERLAVSDGEYTKGDLNTAVKVCEGVVGGYVATAFPEYEPLPDAFRELVVYVRKQTEDET
jgi:hypothetical protein